MTELFKCRKSGTKCCAPKYLIREASGYKEDESTKTESSNSHTSETTTTSYAHAITTVHTSMYILLV